MAVQATRQEIVRVLRKTGFTEVAESPSVYRWVVEQGFALLHWFRRLRIRSEIRDDIHEGFLRFACAIICWRRLHNISNC